jgi:hypothetical protein
MTFQYTVQVAAIDIILVLTEFMQAVDNSAIALLVNLLN